MEVSSPICLRPKELVELAGLLIHSLIPTAVLQCLRLLLYVQKFLVNSYRKKKKKLNQHQIVAGSFKSGRFSHCSVSWSSWQPAFRRGTVRAHIFCSTKDAKSIPFD